MLNEAREQLTACNFMQLLMHKQSQTYTTV